MISITLTKVLIFYNGTNHDVARFEISVKVCRWHVELKFPDSKTTTERFELDW